MKYILFALLLLSTAPVKAASFPVSPGLDAGSFGSMVAHDFRSRGTLTGLQWDALHFKFTGSDQKVNEFGEAGLFGSYRDVDAAVLVGPSVGTPGSGLGDLAAFLSDHGLNWPILKPLTEYGNYAHAYFVTGWDLAHPRQMHGKPNVYGLGGVLKFGASS